jgi:hypothetical protein
LTARQLGELVDLVAERERIPAADRERCRLEVMFQLWACEDFGALAPAHRAPRHRARRTSGAGVDRGRETDPADVRRLRSRRPLQVDVRSSAPARIAFSPTTNSDEESRAT